jgi:hypothetical protein
VQLDLLDVPSHLCGNGTYAGEFGYPRTCQKVGDEEDRFHYAAIVSRTARPRNINMRF